MSRSPHILIVDDDPKIRNGLSKFLSEQGLRTTTACDGRDMQTKLANANVDLAILDVMMPGEDGLSLCGRLATDTSIPVILLTAVAGETDRVIGLEIGAEDYVCKPFSQAAVYRPTISKRRTATGTPSSPALRCGSSMDTHQSDWTERRAAGKADRR